VYQKQFDVFMVFFLSSAAIKCKLREKLLEVFLDSSGFGEEIITLFWDIN